MVQLVDSDIQTREVLGWKGLHLLHHPMAACSKKTRIYMNVKGIAWESHIIDIRSGENYGEWFLGINPRGLIPVLVDDGDVHIESNDILMYLETKFPEPRLIRSGGEAEMTALLEYENSLHFDLRTLVFRFFFPGPTPSKTPESLKQYCAGGSGTVQGREDKEKSVQVDFWETVTREGIPDETARLSVFRFKTAFDGFESQLARTQYLHGDMLTILDIAWFIYADRLNLAGYPFTKLHPRVGKWFDQLTERPEFSKEVAAPEEFMAMIRQARSEQEAAGKTLSQVAGF